MLWELLQRGRSSEQAKELERAMEAQHPTDRRQIRRATVRRLRRKKAMTLRRSQEQAEAIEAIAQADGVPVAEAVRTAIAAHIEQRRKDKAFQQRLQSSKER